MGLRPQLDLRGHTSKEGRGWEGGSERR